MEERLRPLTEQECYARLYGERNVLVTVIPGTAGQSSWLELSSQELRQAFLEHLDARIGADGVEEAA